MNSNWFSMEVTKQLKTRPRLPVGSVSNGAPKGMPRRIIRGLGEKDRGWVLRMWAAHGVTVPAGSLAKSKSLASAPRPRIGSAGAARGVPSLARPIISSATRSGVSGPPGPVTLAARMASWSRQACTSC